jgi:outer membrane receptor for ferrienterochelin and colicin
VTSLLAAIYQTSAGAADTTAVTGEAVDDTSEQMTVTAPAPVLKAGSEHSISAQELQDKGANDFGSIMRYEPLISATGASGGSGNGKSGFDRGGYTGYNIRGMESNRVGIDVDGIAQPNATGRATSAARASTPSASAAIISTRICTAAWIFSPAPPRRKPPTALSAAMSLSAEIGG